MKIAGLYLMSALFLASAGFGGHLVRARHWGGVEVQLDIRQNSSRIEFACAHGIITDRFAANRQGQFDLLGTYVLDGPGPITQIHSAHYVGEILGKTMRLTVNLVDTGETIGPFLLTRGEQGFIVKCL